MIEYSIKTPNADPKEVVIESRGSVVSFTLRELEQNMNALAKNKKEVEGKRTLEAARMKNVEDHHPFVLKMSGEDLVAAHMYQEAKADVKMCDDKLKEINDAIAQEEEGLGDILKQLPELTASKVETTGKK